MSLLLFYLLFFASSDAFNTNSWHKRKQAVLASSLPSIEELENDPFMKQVQHGADLCSALQEDPSNADIHERIKAQLRSSDGIRGFMVSYLTSEDTSPKALVVPDGLAEVLQEITRSNPEDLVPLAFMNVIMPTAMSTMHNEEDLRQSSVQTAKRGLSILATMTGEHQSVKSNAKAILNVALDSKGEDIDSKLIEYWNSFFDKWGYKDEQKKDISESMSLFLTSNYTK
ncbi:unnamed protein product [Cylindrotheca closterium]|uniref:HEAT repeat-containing protein 1 n=1 Tax=Cylindrotheca closterium TaxID=2856 RepID=A0AAD2FID7_9STRA|nr:unnamed protein product [Cylindrotheca closterium]